MKSVFHNICLFICDRKRCLFDDTIDGDPEELVGDGVDRHHGEVLGEGAQRVVVSLGDAVGPVEDPQCPRHGLVRVEVCVEEVQHLQENICTELKNICSKIISEQPRCSATGPRS